MKKLSLLLCALTIVFSSCSSDDDSGSQDPQQDIVVGTWKLSMELVDGVEQPLLPCDLEETLLFNSNNTYTETYYEEDANSNCVVDESFSGTWENTGNGSYSLIDGGDTDPFTVSGNTLTFITIFDNGTPNDTSDDFSEAYVYTKQ